MSHDPTAMTLRARTYLIVVDGLRALILGALLIFTPQVFDNQIYDTARLLTAGHLFLWGIVFVVVGGYAAFAAVIGSSKDARIALVASATLTAVWASLYILNTIVLDVSLAPWIVLSTCALVATDILMCAQPLRTPFEALARQQAIDHVSE